MCSELRFGQTPKSDKDALSCNPGSYPDRIVEVFFSKHNKTAHTVSSVFVSYVETQQHNSRVIEARFIILCTFRILNLGKEDSSTLMRKKCEFNFLLVNVEIFRSQHGLSPNTWAENRIPDLLQEK